MHLSLYPYPYPCLGTHFILLCLSLLHVIFQYKKKTLGFSSQFIYNKIVVNVFLKLHQSNKIVLVLLYHNVTGIGSSQENFKTLENSDNFVVLLLV